MKTVVVCFFYETERAYIRNYERSVDTYFERFETWARVHNEMIVFVQDKYKERVINIRKKYSLENRTHVVVFEKTLEEMFPQEYAMCKKNIDSSDLTYNVIRMMPTFTSVNYCIVTCAKFRLLKWASDIVNEECNFLYVDFGLADLGTYSLKTEDFDREISTESFPNDLITVYTYDDIKTTVPVYSLIRYAIGYFYTNIMIVPSKQCNWLEEKFYDCFRTILRVGLTAQDQNVMYMLWRENPENFNVIIQNYPYERYLKLLDLKEEQIKCILPHKGLLYEKLRKTKLKKFVQWYKICKENRSYMNREKTYIKEIVKQR